MYPEATEGGATFGILWFAFWWMGVLLALTWYVGVVGTLVSIWFWL